MIERCPHDVHPKACGICLRVIPKPRGPKPKVRTFDGWTEVAVFDAEFDTPCADLSCTKRIKPDDEAVRWRLDDMGATTHRGCQP